MVDPDDPEMLQVGAATVTVEWPDPPDFSLTGTYRSGILVQLYGMFGSCLSIANVCAQFARILANRVDGLALYNYERKPFLNPDLEEYAFVDIGAPIGIFYGIPDQVPDKFFMHPFKVGGFVCETNRIHRSWADLCNRFDLIIVPSTFCKRAFCDSGVIKPVMVVPHGLESEYTTIGPRKRGEPFVFYNTFDSASFARRKSAEELVRCFLEAFDRRPDVVLRLRTQPSAEMIGLQRRHRFGSVIKLDTTTALSVKDFARIYSEVSCTVHPSKGEGFGLIPLQSIACETPVIAPRSTGMADYLDDSNAMCLRVGPPVKGEGMGNQAGTYFAVDEPHLVEVLGYAVDNWEQEYQKVRLVGPSFRAAHTWESALSGFVDVIKKIQGSDDLDRIRQELAQELP